MLNPSHALIARNGPLRSPAEPHITAPRLAPTGTAVGGGGDRAYFDRGEDEAPRQAPATPSRIEDGPSSAQVPAADPSRLPIHPTFQRSVPPGKWDGTVQLIVERETFWAHAEMLYFASPFFEAILGGEWAETSGVGRDGDSVRSGRSRSSVLDSGKDHGATIRHSGHKPALDSQRRRARTSRAQQTALERSPLGPRFPAGDAVPPAAHGDVWCTAAQAIAGKRADASDGAVSHGGPGSSLAEAGAQRRSEAIRQREPQSVYEDALSEIERLTVADYTLDKASKGDGGDEGDWESASEDEDDRTEGHAANAPQEDHATGDKAMVDRGVQTDPEMSLTALNIASHADRGLASATMSSQSPVPRDDYDVTSLAHSEVATSHAEYESICASAIARKRQSLCSTVTVRTQASARRGTRGKDSRPTAIIELKEEKAKDVHELLCWIYPHLDCTITWSNVEGLISLADKLSIPALSTACHSFLFTHAAGRPIKTMEIAETYGYAELYMEGSRFVLDNMGSWEPEELAVLSRDTAVKLHAKRSWYLERLMKLQIANMTRDYTCCPSCPDRMNCAKLVEEKWRSAYIAAWRYGSPQPSIVYRYLRQLETSPPLILQHTACQTAAKVYFATLFDRMFANQSPNAPPIGRQKHFLYIRLCD